MNREFLVQFVQWAFYSVVTALAVILWGTLNDIRADSKAMAGNLATLSENVIIIVERNQVQSKAIEKMESRIEILERYFLLNQGAQGRK